MKTESRFFYWSVMVGHDVVLKATSGPRRKKGWEPLAYAQRTEPAGFASVFAQPSVLFSVGLSKTQFQVPIYFQVYGNTAEANITYCTNSCRKSAGRKFVA